MIASLRGTCLATSGETAIVDVGGVGYRLTCTPGAMGSLRQGAECRLATALVVREDAWTLYGFADDDERDLFDQLTSVSGIGPRMAVAAVGSLGVEQLRTAIGASDIATLTRVPGIGKKGAERIALELRDKMPTAAAVPSRTGSAQTPGADLAGWQSAVLEGLVGLGWQTRDAERAVSLVAADILADSLDPEDIPALLRRALSRLDRV